MTYPVTELITHAWYWSGNVSRGQQSLTKDQTTDGLYLLNALLSVKAANNRLIPYFKEYTLIATPGQEKYFIPNLLSAEVITFNIGTVRYSTINRARKAYFGAPRVDNISSLPFNYHVERTLDGADLYLYFQPFSDYPIKIWGKFGLSEIGTFTQDLSLVYDRFYITYLELALAEYMCMYRQISVPPQLQGKLNECEAIITDISPIDFTVNKMSMLQKDSGYNYGDVNFGQGYRP